MSYLGHPSISKTFFSCPLGPRFGHLQGALKSNLVPAGVHVHRPDGMHGCIGLRIFAAHAQLGTSIHLKPYKLKGKPHVPPASTAALPKPPAVCGDGCPVSVLTLLDRADLTSVTPVTVRIPKLF